MQDLIQQPGMPANQQTGLPPIDQAALPTDVQSAQQDEGDQSYKNYCEMWVEQQAYGKTGLFPTAASAIDYYSQNGMAYSGTEGMQPGDLVYFAPDKSNNNEGHAGIASTDGNFISATANGVQELPIAQWEKDTGQKLVGYVPNPSNTQTASQAHSADSPPPQATPAQ